MAWAQRSRGLRVLAQQLCRIAEAVGLLGMQGLALVVHHYLIEDFVFYWHQRFLLSLSKFPRIDFPVM